MQLMRDISQILDDLNIILTNAIILGFNFDEAKQCLYVTFQTGITNDRFLFNFKNIGRMVSLSDNIDKKTIKFYLNSFPCKITESVNNKVYECKSLNDSSIIFAADKKSRSFDMVFTSEFKKQPNVHLSQDNKNCKQQINILIWFELIELFDDNLNSLDIEIFIKKFKEIIK